MVVARGVSNVDVVVNPSARRLRPGSLRRRIILEEARRGGARVHEPASLEQLDQLATMFASHPGTSRVLFAGGDGTFMRGLSAVVRAFGDAPLPLIGLVPAGTVGTVARHFGPRGADGARHVIRAACSGEADALAWARAHRQLTLRVRDDAGGAYVGLIFGAGLVARFFDEYNRGPRQGLPTAAAIAARVFAGSFVGSGLARRVLAPTRCAIEVDGQAHPSPTWSLVVASVVRDLGLHFIVTYRAGDAERFHVVASGLQPSALGPQMLRVLRGRPLRGEPRVDALARSLRVTFEAPDAYVLDGDVIGARSVTVEAGPLVHVLRC
jgi:diacylglycerol kinase family enzyme